MLARRGASFDEENLFTNFVLPPRDDDDATAATNDIEVTTAGLVAS